MQTQTLSDGGFDATDLEFHRREHLAEMGEPSAEDSRWERFCNDVEELLEIDNLDGDESGDGYSLDSAYEAFEAGKAAREYTRSVAEKRRDMGL